MAHEKLKKALAENTAHMKVLADQYVRILARAQREIEAEEASENPSVWRVRALEEVRNRAEENLARFKSGPERLPEWLHEPKRSEIH